MSNNGLQIVGAACLGHGLPHGLEHVLRGHTSAFLGKMFDLPSGSLQNPNRPMSDCVDKLLSLHAIGTRS